MLTIILVIIGLSILIFGHEAGHFFVAKLFKLKIDEFGFGFPPRIFAKKKGETEYSLNWLPFGGFVKIAGENDRISSENEKLESLTPEEKKRIFLFQPAWKRALIILAGVTINFVIGWLLISIVFMVGTPKELVVSGVQEASPAAIAGIKTGDVVKNYLESAPFVDFISANKGKEISVQIKRGGENLEFKVTPRITKDPNVGALGVELTEAGFGSSGFFKSFYDGLITSAQLVWMTLKAFGLLVKNLVLTGKLLEGVVGPVGVFGVAQTAGRLGIIYIVNLIALISINLAVLNLLPFPALDGGRFFLILIEKIKGSPIPVKVEGIINGVGFALLILLMVVVTIRDVWKLF